jgi:cytoskeletal protein RodZ
MENDKRNNTLEEILEEDSAAIKKKGKRKGCLVRSLLVLTVLILFFFGLMYVVQYMTDLEAEARVSAILTASANPDDKSETQDSVLEEPVEEGEAETGIEAAPTETPEIVTATPDQDLARTATIAAQLTAVAEFQATDTPAE